MNSGVIKASECDSEAKLNIISAFDVIEDSITSMLGSYKLDSLSIKPLGYMWVFTKNKVVISKHPIWQSTYKIESHISKISKAIMNIESNVFDESNNILIKAKTEACLLDINTRRIVRLQSLDFSNITLGQESDINFMRLDLNRLYDTKRIVMVSSSNIDFSKHTNNVEYVRFLADSLTLDEYNNINEFEIHFTHESKINDILHIKRCDNNFIILNKDKDVVCEAIIK